MAAGGTSLQISVLPSNARDVPISIKCQISFLPA
jgi:hypothetical protein